MKDEEFYQNCLEALRNGIKPELNLPQTQEGIRKGYLDQEDVHLAVYNLRRKEKRSEIQIKKINGGPLHIISSMLLHPLPRDFRIEKVKRVLTRLETLAKDYDSVLNLGDLDREGEEILHLGEFEGMIQGDVTYSFAYDPHYLGVVRSPGRIHLDVTVPTIEHNEIKNAFKKVLKPFSSYFLP